MKYLKLIHQHPTKAVYMVLVFTSLVFISVAQATDSGHKIKPQQSQLTGLPPLTLWYNGDWDSDANAQAPNYLALACDEAGYGRSYDDFIVSSPNGWKVTGVFANVFVDDFVDCFILSDAMWEIRQGVDYGTPGNVVASGFMDGASVNLTGNYTPSGLDEYQILVTGLDISLPPGTYWLNVTPIGNFGTGYGYGPLGGISQTMGTNCIGSPCGNDHLSFLVDSSGDYWAALNADYSMGVTGISCPGNCELYVIGASSIKIAQSGQIEPVVLPLTGETAVEDRSSVPRGNYTIQMTFTQNITSTGRVTASCGRVASTSIDGGTLTVNLTGVACDASDVTVIVNDVKDDTGQNLGAASATMGLLIGDVDGNRVVDQNDLTIIRSELGQGVNDTNFRSDVNGDGVIDEADVQLATRELGTLLPP